MPDDRMHKDSLQKNMRTGEKDKNYQQSPGKGGQQDKQAGQHAGGQQSGGQFGGQKGTRNMDEDEDLGTQRTGSQNRGGQNR